MQAAIQDQIPTIRVNFYCHDKPERELRNCDLRRTMARIEEMGIDEFCDYLLEEKEFHSDVVTSFSRNRISGATFMGLSEDDLKDLVPVIGDRVNVRKLLVEAREVQSFTCLWICETY